MERENVTFYGVDKPYELYYRNEITLFPVGVHMHNVTEIYLTMTNLPDVLLGDTVRSVKRGALIVIPPFCAHQLYHEKDVVYERYIFNVDIRWLDSVLAYNREELAFLRRGDEPTVYLLSEEEIERITTLFKEFLPLCAKEDIKALTGFCEILTELKNLDETRRGDRGVMDGDITKEQKRINEIITFINNHITEGITISEVAEHFYLSKDYLARIFLKATHTSIGQYIIIQKIAKAQSLLREGKTVGEVQEILQYSSYAYFFRSFQKIAGMSPKQYRSEFINEKLHGNNVTGMA